MLPLLTGYQESTLDVPETGDVESVPVEGAQVVEPGNLEESLLIEGSPAPEPVLEPSNEVRELPLEADPVIATPLTLAVPEHLMEPVVIQEAPAVNSVVDVAPDVVAAEGSGPPAEEPDQEVLISATPGPTVEPIATKGSTSNPLELDVPAPEPSIESESARERQESEADRPPTLSEENPSTDETELNDASPAISGSVETARDAPTSDVPQEQTSQTERSWTPSYSVSSQGGGLDTSQTANEEVVEPTPAPESPAEELVTEPAPASETVTSVEVCTLGLPLPP